MYLCSPNRKELVAAYPAHLRLQYQVRRCRSCIPDRPGRCSAANDKLSAQQTSGFSTFDTKCDVRPSQYEQARPDLFTWYTAYPRAAIAQSPATTAGPAPPNEAIDPGHLGSAQYSAEHNCYPGFPDAAADYAQIRRMSSSIRPRRSCLFCICLCLADRSWC